MMTKINVATTNSIEDHASSFATLASLGVLMCMIASLVGIKIWWFKHRLTFDHNSTRNGVAGGHQPSVVMRQRNSKDKRQSQQYLESVEVHGVFRKRQEDELEFQPPTQLPPVRIRKLSQSTTSLLLPPRRRRHEVKSTAFEELQPPVREPPRPPVESQPTTPTQEEMLTFEEFEKRFKKIEEPVVEQTPQQPIIKEEEKIFVPPQPPKRLNRGTSNDVQGSVQKVLKARAALAEAEHKRRLTEFARPNDDFQADEGQNPDIGVTQIVEEFGERRPTGYIKYEDLGMEGLEDFRQKWDDMPLGMEAKHYDEYDERGRLAVERDFLQYDDYHAHRKVDFERDFPPDDYSISPPSASEGGSVERKPVKYIRSSERMWKDIDLSVNYEDKKNLYSKNAHEQIHLEETSMSQHAFTDPPILKVTRADSYIGNAETSNIETTEFQIHHGKDYTPPPHNVKFLVPETHAFEDIDTRHQQVRRPTGFVHRDDNFWGDLEKIEIGEEDDEQHMWLEMEKDINKDFATNIEEEFNKIRHSYEANEGDFLEIRDELKKYSYNRENSVSSPKGYGKTIDEDWESFQNLEIAKENLNSTETNPLKHEGAKYSEIPIPQNVTFNFAELEDVNEKQHNSLYTQERRPTAYARNLKGLDADDDNKSDLEEQKYKIKVKFNIEEITDDIDSDSDIQQPSILKERRPTGFIRRDLGLEHEEATVHEYKSIGQPVIDPIQKPKPRQKVTFDFNTEEHHYVPANHQFSDYDSELSDDHNSKTPPEVPKPMQRTTKIRYTDESSVQVETKPLPSLPTPPILFSTQVSMTDDIQDDGVNVSDSWSAIRQHRFLTEEFQQISLAQQEIVPPREAAPRAAYRNPLAQMSDLRSTVEVETEQEQVKPLMHTMREMKQTKTETRQYIENYGTSTTEA